MTRKRYAAGDFPTKALAVKEGRRQCGGTGYTSKLFSPYKTYETKKVGKLWRLYLIEKTMYEQLMGKKYRRRTR